LNLNKSENLVLIKKCNINQIIINKYIKYTLIIETLEKLNIQTILNRFYYFKDFQLLFLSLIFFLGIIFLPLLKYNY